MSDAFWEDLARDLQDPEFRRQYEAETAAIVALDAERVEVEE